METYFQIRYEFDQDAVHAAIARSVETSVPAYICVADGNILAMVQRDRSYREVIYDSLFSLCDSGWVPLYLRALYGIRRRQYCGAQIFRDIVSEGKYRMAFLGTDNATLELLKRAITSWNPQVADMPFMELPFCDVERFDYSAISEQINARNVDVIWVALGAPKQERFMNLLSPYLERGVMLGVGAAFNFYSGQVKRAPHWMIACKLEFFYRLFSEPRKQVLRCRQILVTLPLAFQREKKRKLIARLGKKMQSLRSSYVSPGQEEVFTAFGQTPAQLDSVLKECASRPETRFTIISDDARLWELPANVNVVPVAGSMYNELDFLP